MIRPSSRPMGYSPAAATAVERGRAGPDPGGHVTDSYPRSPAPSSESTPPRAVGALRAWTVPPRCTPGLPPALPFPALLRARPCPGGTRSTPHARLTTGDRTAPRFSANGALKRTAARTGPTARRSTGAARVSPRRCNAPSPGRPLPLLRQPVRSAPRSGRPLRPRPSATSPGAQSLSRSRHSPPTAPLPCRLPITVG